VIGVFGTLSGAGLEMLLGDEGGVRVLASGVDDAALECELARHRPEVAILGRRSIMSCWRACES